MAYQKMQCYTGKPEQGKRTWNMGWGIMFVICSSGVHAISVDLERF